MCLKIATYIMELGCSRYRPETTTSRLSEVGPRIIDGNPQRFLLDPDMKRVKNKEQV
jgi:hypothetical protein